MSMIGLNLPEETIMLNPIGGIGRPGREMLLDLYAGLVLDPPATFDPAWANDVTAVISFIPSQPMVR